MVSIPAEIVIPCFFQVNPKFQFILKYEDIFDIVLIWNRNDNGFITIIDHPLDPYSLTLNMV
jgi:hypothetical protein